MEKIGIKFDTNSMLNMLCNSLYDTPMVLLRENLQNAYDAVLMRKRKDKLYSNPSISISIQGNRIEVKDNGIGMSAHEIRENFWTAGKSGKNNDEAKAAGVVGTFGIGAFANFGACDTLQLVTHKIGENQVCTCMAKKDSLNDDIELNIGSSDEPTYGTTITVELSAGKVISEREAIEYMEPYVKYINIPVTINGNLISCNDYSNEFNMSSLLHYETTHGSIKYEFDYSIKLNKGTLAKSKIYITNIVAGGEKHAGDILLHCNEHVIWGLRSGFGLSTIPIYSNYGFGGFVNLMELKPTAGREAISKDNITFVQRIVNVVEVLYSEIVAEREESDTYREFLNYINSHFSSKLALNIKIQIANEERTFIKLGDLLEAGNNFKYYIGADSSIPKKYATANFKIVVASRDNPRRSIQKKFLETNGIQELEDKVQVLEIFDYKDMETEYYVIGHTIQKILEFDYLIPDNEVFFATISHGVRIFVDKKEDKGKETISIYITKNENEISNLIDVYKNNYNIFEPLMKDYVRNYIYQQISDFIPSSKRSGVVALCNMLQKRKETYSIYKDDTESMDNLFVLYKDGKISEDELAAKIRKNRNYSQQTVTSGNIRSVESVISTIAVSMATPNFTTQEGLDNINMLALPPISHFEVVTNAKLLTTEETHRELNGYKKFLSFTDRMANENYNFFLNSHTTKVIWSTHRIIYIFMLSKGYYTLYYDMELKKHLNENLTGGAQLSTTTIITKDKIFVPIPHELENYFSLKDGPLHFSIHYDIVEGETQITE